MFSSTTAPDKCACAAEPPSPRETPVRVFVEIPVKEIYSRSVFVAVPFPSTRSITRTPGA